MFANNGKFSDQFTRLQVSEKLLLQFKPNLPPVLLTAKLLSNIKIQKNGCPHIYVTGVTIGSLIKDAKLVYPNKMVLLALHYFAMGQKVMTLPAGRHDGDPSFDIGSHGVVAPLQGKKVNVHWQLRGCGCLRSCFNLVDLRMIHAGGPFNF